MGYISYLRPHAAGKGAQECPLKPSGQL